MESYFDLIDQTFDFPTKEFDVKNGELYFHDIPLMDVVKKFGSPLKLTYLPNISYKIKKANNLFKKAIKNNDYKGKHIYCYCTKSSHYEHVVNKALESKAHIETSSAFDIFIVNSLIEKEKLDEDSFILCNGFKRPLYLQKISELVNRGFKKCIPILDNTNEIDYYFKNIKGNFKVGIRVATEEIPNFEFYTSRLGIRYSEVLDFYSQKIKDSKAELTMLHFFVNNGIKDDTYYWNELNKFVYKYCELKKICPTLNSIDIGGGLPVKTSLTFDFDFGYMIDEIVRIIKSTCEEQEVEVPDIFTEFGSFTVAESGATIFSILDTKLQNDRELWYMIDGSFITHLPDTWGLSQRFILLPLNQWNKKFQKVNIGGLTCDSMDYYNSEAHGGDIFLPIHDNKAKPLYIGLFHTGAYQDALGGAGGIQHCLIPSPKRVLIDKHPKTGKVTYELFSEEQKADSMLSILGYS